MAQQKTPTQNTSTGEFLLIAGVAVAVAVGMSLWIRRSDPVASGTAGLAVGSKAPAIAANEWINGEPSGEPGVKFVHGWFTTCPACWKHSSELVELHEVYGDRVEFIGLAVEDEQSSAAVADFIEQNGYTWPNGYAAVPTLQGFEAQYFPCMWVLDRNGTVVWNRDSSEPIETALDRLLADG